MIISYRDTKIRRFVKSDRIREIYSRQAELRLDRLDAATSLQDLAALPGNRFEELEGDGQSQYSIRVNDQWQICFEWPDGSPGPIEVDIIDNR
jgi:proteic killer suppression protein